MLRHLKMELKRREELADSSSSSNSSISVADSPTSGIGSSIKSGNCIEQTKKGFERLQTAVKKQQVVGRRVRGRRSSKPMMEKKRRARINECLDILKSYVLGDSTNLVHLGIDAAATENRDEETLARTILKSSGLINRHRGRKNPNKLEKADILELTVDYVRRLHEQRDEWMKQTVYSNQLNQASTASSLGPLRLNLAAIDKAHIQLQTTPPSPPPSSSSTSSSPKPLLTISSNIQQQSPPVQVTSSCPDVLDLSDHKRTRGDQLQYPSDKPFFNEDGLMFYEGADGCWRTWKPTLLYN